LGGAWGTMLGIALPFISLRDARFDLRRRQVMEVLGWLRGEDLP
jgi:hypothetical protein